MIRGKSAVKNSVARLRRAMKAKRKILGATIKPIFFHAYKKDIGKKSKVHVLSHFLITSMSAL